MDPEEYQDFLGIGMIIVSAHNQALYEGRGFPSSLAA
jgi:hypothetical protein